jgi:putative inorganic carbon (HCO3(-)) transporter
MLAMSSALSAPPNSRRGSASPRVAWEDAVLALRPRALIQAFFRQSPAFWFTSLYIFFEYVRPQQIYTWMDVAPWPLISLVGAVVATLFERRFNFNGKRLWAMVAAFSLVVFASSFTAQRPSISWDAIDVWVNWMLLIFVIGAGIRNRLELLLLLLTFCLWNLKMSQHGVQGWFRAGFSFQASGVSGGPGWFQNSGEFGIEMCVFLPIVGYLAMGLWPRLRRSARLVLVAVIASALISMVVTSSRGALVGGAGIGIWVLLRSPNRLRAAAIVAIAASLIYFILPAESKARFSAMGKDKDSIARLTYWRDGVSIANDHPVLGIGYKNWIPYYRQNYNPKGEVPHNFLVECAAELGYVGVIVLLGLLGAFFLENAHTRRVTGPDAPNPDRFLWSMAHGLDGAMIGFMISGSFVTVLFYPYIWMNIALALALATVVRRRSGSKLVARRAHTRGIVRPYLRNEGSHQNRLA